jgi:hypothetical protein
MFVEAWLVLAASATTTAAATSTTATATTAAARAFVLFADVLNEVRAVFHDVVVALTIRATTTSTTAASFVVLAAATSTRRPHRNPAGEQLDDQCFELDIGLFSDKEQVAVQLLRNLDLDLAIHRSLVDGRRRLDALLAHVFQLSGQRGFEVFERFAARASFYLAGQLWNAGEIRDLRLLVAIFFVLHDGYDCYAVLIHVSVPIFPLLFDDWRADVKQICYCASGSREDRARSTRE